MTGLDTRRINQILREKGFGEVETIVTGGREGACSTVYELRPVRGGPEMVLKLYERDIGSKQIVKNEFDAMKKAYDITDTFPVPYAFIKFDGCQDPRFGDVTETLYGIVMEKLEPVTFKSRPSDKEVLILLKDVLEEVVIIHKIGKFRHGDIKLANLMWCERKGKYTLIDFNTSDIHSNTSATTTSYSLFGSKYYLDPQSLTTGEFNYSYSPRSDIYALGMTARFLMNNNRYEYTLKGDPTNEELLAAKRKLGDFKSVKYSKELCALVSKATAFERDDRFQSAQEMLDAVVDLLTRMGVKVDTPAFNSSEEFIEKTIITSDESNRISDRVRRRIVLDDTADEEIASEGVRRKTYFPEESVSEADVYEETAHGVTRVTDNTASKDNPFTCKVTDNDEFKVNKFIEHSNTTRKNQIVKAIRCSNFDTALRLLEKSKDKYTHFFRGCAYLGKQDGISAEKEFLLGEDKMSYYMLYCLNSEKSPAYANQCLEKASAMHCAPAMFYDGYSKYKSKDAAIRKQGLELIVKSAQLRYWEAYRYLCKLQRRHEVSPDLVANIPLEGLTKALSYFAD